MPEKLGQQHVCVTYFLLITLRRKDSNSVPLSCATLFEVLSYFTLHNHAIGGRSDQVFSLMNYTYRRF